MSASRRMVLMLATMVVAVLLAGGVALAEFVDGTSGDGTRLGTSGSDVIHVEAGNDTIEGGTGADEVYAGPGDDYVTGGLPEGSPDGAGDGDRDTIHTSGGADTIDVADDPALRDFLYCGADVDEVAADSLDVVAADCEDTDRLLSEQQARNQMAQSYAADYDVPVAEASRRLSLQDDVGDLGAALEANEGATFGDLYIQHEPSFRVVALSTRGGAQTVAPYVAGTPLEAEIEVRPAEATLRELRAAQARAISAYEATGVPFESDINVQQNRAEIYVTQQRRVSSSSSPQLPPHVEVLTVDTLSTPDRSITGGYRFTPPGGASCTTAFTVRYNANTEGQLTAAHCSDNMYYRGDYMRFRQQDQTGSSDAQWHTTFGYEDLAYFRSSGAANSPVRRVAGRTNQRVGRYVCKFGQTTGRTCGRIAGRDYTPSEYINSANSTFIRVHKQSGGNLSSAGDSGSPWFDGAIALGVHSGSSRYNSNDAIYMAINYATFDTYMGLKVQTR